MASVTGHRGWSQLSADSGSALVARRGRLKRAALREMRRDMSKKLFVGSLSWDTNDDGLNAAFSPFGEITEATVITDRHSGRSRGFGFVTFADDEAAEKAVAELNGTELDGRTIRVDVAHARERSGGGGGGGGGGGRDRW